ncbi:hypothetical protein SDC9_159783 [bioreactor metagenome]|uniref:Uncharacterized protein n=1 Tax=bioreactor metagenome TaxID=1076179 RepID=A0A645FDI5_9ZZZZ
MPLDVADALCAQQPVEIRRGLDQREEVRAPLRIHCVVEHVGQARAEHALTAAVLLGECLMVCIPCQGLAPVGRAGSNALTLGPPNDLAHAGIHEVFGIAVVTGRGNLCAPDEGIECVVRPLDFAVLGHAALQK